MGRIEDGSKKNRKKLITYDDVVNSKEVVSYLEIADRHLGALGFTEHGSRHCSVVAKNAGRIMIETGRSERRAELARIAGYLHDIGNVTGRVNHAQSGALISYQILRTMGMSPDELGLVMNAIANHDEETGDVTNDVTAAVILADKSDVHRSRVRNPKFISFDIHDRVNYACTRSRLEIEPIEKVISLDLIIDTEISKVLEYFEIFLSRMLLCKKASEILEMRFEMIINGVKIL